jgi:hypothetical protein
MNKVTIMLESFEGISESQGKKLVGGFSASFTASRSSFTDESVANNCKGGNCVVACGGNSACNTVANCKCVPTLN